MYYLSFYQAYLVKAIPFPCLPSHMSSTRKGDYYEVRDNTTQEESYDKRGCFSEARIKQKSSSPGVLSAHGCCEKLNTG